MKLEGIHHITAITGDAPRNVDFYVRVLGLRMVKKTVNQDDPTVYHLFYADEHGSAGADLTFFEYPNARPGRAGAGMVHRIVHRVGSADTLDFWADRLGAEGVVDVARRTAARCASPTRRASSTSCVVVDVPDAPLTARSTEVPDEHALQGFHAVHAAVADPRKSEALLDERPGLRGDAASTRSRRAATRAAARSCFEPAAGRGFGGAGTIHHIAWATTFDEHDAWREQRRSRRPAGHAGDRPLLLQVGLLPRARRDPVRARDDRPGLHDRRAARDARRAAGAAAGLRAPARPGRAAADAAARHAPVAPGTGASSQDAVERVDESPGGASVPGCRGRVSGDFAYRRSRAIRRDTGYGERSTPMPPDRRDVGRACANPSAELR